MKLSAVAAICWILAGILKPKADNSTGELLSAVSPASWCSGLLTFRQNEPAPSTFLWSVNCKGIQINELNFKKR